MDAFFEELFQEGKVSSKIIENVIQLCLNDYSRIDNELDKISRLNNLAEEQVEQIVHHKVDKEEHLWQNLRLVQPRKRRKLSLLGILNFSNI